MIRDFQFPVSDMVNVLATVVDRENQIPSRFSQPLSKSENGHKLIKEARFLWLSMVRSLYLRKDIHRRLLIRHSSVISIRLQFITVDRR